MVRSPLISSLARREGIREGDAVPQEPPEEAVRRVGRMEERLKSEHEKERLRIGGRVRNVSPSVRHHGQLAQGRSASPNVARNAAENHSSPGSLR
eukprot:2039221-Rhodomonas_salina.1